MTKTATVRELLERKREIEERKLGLQKYEMELRKIIGRINEITYRKWENREQEKQSLQAQKRTIATGLKAEYNLTPARIPYQLREYDHALLEINRNLNTIERQVSREPFGAHGLSSPLSPASRLEAAKERAALPQQLEQSQGDRKR